MLNVLKWLAIGACLVVVGLGLLFLAVRRGPVPYATLEARYATPASRFMDLPGGLHLHYRDEGRSDAPVLVLVHGFADSTATWNSWIKALGADYRIISLDLPGHGLTRAPPNYVGGNLAYADLVATVTERLHAPRFVMAGNSMGGGVAWTFALRHPDRLKALILIDAAGWPRTGSNAKTALAFKLLRTGWGRWLLSQIDLKPIIAEGARKAFSDPSRVDAGLINRFADEARAPDHPQILMGMQSGAYFIATPERMAQIHAPTLVMHGEDDNVIPVAHGRQFASAIPGARLIIYPKVGHSPQMEIPEQSASDLKAFLKANGL